MYVHVICTLSILVVPTIHTSNWDTNGTEERAYYSEVCLFQGLENWFLGKEKVARVSLEMVPLQWNLLIWTPMGQKKVKRCPCFRGYIACKQLLSGKENMSLVEKCPHWGVFSVPLRCSIQSLYICMYNIYIHMYYLLDMHVG